MSTVHAITVNEQICRKCGLCVEACIHAKLVQPDKSASPGIAKDMDCIACGHCVAICPTGALSHSAFSSGSIRQLNAELLPTADQMMEALRARRSYRKFKDERIPHEILEQVVEAARLAPSAHNSQTTSFIVVEDPQMLKRVVDLTVTFLDGMAKYFRHPIKGRIAKLVGGDQVKTVLPLIPVFEGVVKLARSGAELPMLLDAPAWIVFHSATNAEYGAVNATCAMQNAMLMADRLGLGTFFSGFALAPTRRGFLLHDLLSLGHDREIHGALAIGVPKLQYKKWASKKPADVRWI